MAGQPTPADRRLARRLLVVRLAGLGGLGPFGTAWAQAPGPAGPVRPSPTGTPPPPRAIPAPGAARPGGRGITDSDPSDLPGGPAPGARPGPGSRVTDNDPNDDVGRGRPTGEVR